MKKSVSGLLEAMLRVDESVCRVTGIMTGDPLLTCSHCLFFVRSLEGDLAVSRGLGDFRFKSMDVVMASTEELKSMDASQVPVTKPEEQKVSPVPDMIVQNRDISSDEFIIIACDGIWDVNTNEECIRIVGELFDEGESDIGLICEEVSHCYWSKVNSTLAIP